MSGLSSTDNQGFTLMEILFAMTILTSALILMTTIFIAINRSFSQGVARKELSEASQSLVEDIARAIRSQGADNLIGSCSSLPSEFDGSLTIGGISYAWGTADSQDRGVWRGGTQCANMSFRLVEDTFTLRQIEVDEIHADDLDGASLFRVSGVMTSGNDSGLIFPAPESNWINDTNSGCSLEANRSRNCSIERFNFVVNGR